MAARTTATAVAATTVHSETIDRSATSEVTATIAGHAAGRGTTGRAVSGHLGDRAIASRGTTGAGAIVGRAGTGRRAPIAGPGMTGRDGLRAVTEATARQGTTGFGGGHGMTRAAGVSGMIEVAEGREPIVPRAMTGRAVSGHLGDRAIASRGTTGAGGAIAGRVATGRRAPIAGPGMTGHVGLRGKVELSAGRRAVGDAGRRGMTGAIAGPGMIALVRGEIGVSVGRGMTRAAGGSGAIVGRGRIGGAGTSGMIVDRDATVRRAAIELSVGRERNGAGGGLPVTVRIGARGMRSLRSGIPGRSCPRGRSWRHSMRKRGGS